MAQVGMRLFHRGSATFADMRLEGAARLMRDKAVGCVVVLRNGKVAGILTDRQVAVNAKDLIDHILLEESHVALHETHVLTGAKRMVKEIRRPTKLDRLPPEQDAMPVTQPTPAGLAASGRADEPPRRKKKAPSKK